MLLLIGVIISGFFIGFGIAFVIDAVYRAYRYSSTIPTGRKTP